MAITERKWRTYSRPDDNGHQYVAQFGYDGPLFVDADGAPVIFSHAQAVAIEAGADPGEAMRIQPTLPQYNNPERTPLVDISQPPEADNGDSDTKRSNAGRRSKAKVKPAQ